MSAEWTERMERRYQEMKRRLEDYKQEHLLKYWYDLPRQSQTDLMDQLESIDFEEMFRMRHKAQEDYVYAEKYLEEDDMMPVDVQVEKECSHSAIEEYRRMGLEEISKGTVAVVVLGGGQGTRLGSCFPKGLCPTGLPSGKTLFQLQAERIQRLMQLAKEKYEETEGVIYWYVMTSDATHDLTEKFLYQSEFFGLKEENVKLFKQQQLPCFDMDGNLFLEEKDELATAPDGNGGMYKALLREGMLADMQAKGVKYIHVHSVDNMLIKVADPVFLGKCMKDQVDLGIKVVKRDDPFECLGIAVNVDDSVYILEYSELAPSTLSLRTPSRENLVFNTGNICIHLFHIDFLAKICQVHEPDMKLHMAKKTATYVGPDGDKVFPINPNCIKLEKFVFDVVGYSKNLLFWQVERSQEFSPVKNSEVAEKFSFPTARADLMALHKTWLENAGAKCQGGAEISPLLSYDGEGLEQFAGKEFKDGDVLVSAKEEEEPMTNEFVWSE